MAFVQVPVEVDAKMREAGCVGYHLWSVDSPMYFKGVDLVKLSLDVFNLYAKAYTDTELSALLANTHYLRVRCFHEEKCSKVSVMTLSFAECNSEDYRKFLRGVTEVEPRYIPCEFNVGPLWHCFGVDRNMIRTRNVTAGYIKPPRLVVSERSIEFRDEESHQGIYLFARDQYPGETEDQIKVTETDGTTVFRKA